VKGPWKYYLKGTSHGPFTQCTDYEGGGRSWCMLLAFDNCRHKEGVSWKYTDDLDDPDCMRNWVSIDCDATKAGPFARTIVYKPTGRSWCALPTYMSGGTGNVMWEWC
jgi:hypothetical protein